MEAPRRDWGDPTPNARDDEGFPYGELHVDIAKASLRCLKALAADPVELVEHREISPWSVPEAKFLWSLHDIDVLSWIMVPPETTVSGDRDKADYFLHDLNDALPFANAERRWLTKVGLSAPLWSPARLKVEDPGFLDPVAEKQGSIVVEGVSRPVSGRGLLERHWMWRREAGIYAGGEGLAQAKVALAGLVNLLRPTLEEPEELARLSGQELPS